MVERGENIIFDDESITCKNCGLSEELCICEDIAKEDTRIRVVLTRRKWGKYYTILSGFDKEIDMRKLGKTLRTKLACGGSVKNNEIELQGNHEYRIVSILGKMGFEEDAIDVVHQS